jgi:hypothetical protein
MVTYQPPDMDDVPIIDAIKLSTVSSHCSAVLAARALGISFGDPFVEACFRNRPAGQEAGCGGSAVEPKTERQKPRRGANLPQSR